MKANLKQLRDLAGMATAGRCALTMAVVRMAIREEERRLLDLREEELRFAIGASGAAVNPLGGGG